MISSNNNFDNEWNKILMKEKNNNDINIEKNNKLGLDNKINLVWNDLVEKEIYQNDKNIENYEFKSMIKEDKKEERLNLEIKLKKNGKKEDTNTSYFQLPYFISQYF